MREVKGDISCSNRALQVHRNGLPQLAPVARDPLWSVLLDEAEAITSLARVQDRNAANENIRAIIDGADEMWLE